MSKQVGAYGVRNPPYIFASFHIVYVYVCQSTAYMAYRMGVEDGKTNGPTYLHQNARSGRVPINADSPTYVGVSAEDWY